jgi:DeoR/GlpR family transcriptional regulator of sugar metabolism
MIDLSEVNPTNDLSPNQRQEWVAEYILQQGLVTVDDLADRFAVSRMTIHRDLDELEKQGVLRKVRGGATASPSPLFESDIRYRERVTTKEKEAIARYAFSLVDSGQAVMLDDSTTTLALARLLKDVKPLTILTNCLGIMREIHDVKGVRLISMGGEYLPRYDAFTGLICEQSISSVRANLLFMSTSAISGLLAFHQEQEIVKVKQMMMSSATKRILLIDHTKVGKVALHRLAELSDFDLVVVDSGVDPKYVEEMRNAHIPLELAPL